MKIVFGIMLFVLISSQSIASEIQFSLVNAKLIKYFNYKIGDDKILSSTKIWIGGNCDKDGYDNGLRFFPIIDSDSTTTFCMSFDFESVKEVLLLTIGCRYDPVFVAFYELNPKRNIRNLVARKKVSCKYEEITMLLYVKTSDNKIYASSYLFLSGQGGEYYQAEPMLDILH